MRGRSDNARYPSQPPDAAPTGPASGHGQHLPDQHQPSCYVSVNGEFPSVDFVDQFLEGLGGPHFDEQAQS